jgi:hypothetical protein
MKIKVPFNKENIKILKNIKQDNKVNFKVLIEDKIIEVIFKKLKIAEDHYKDINNDFLDLIINKAKECEISKKIYKDNDTYIIKEVTEKIVSLKLNVENTVALEKLLEKYPDKTQTDMLNELIKKGINYKLNTFTTQNIDKV